MNTNFVKAVHVKLQSQQAALNILSSQAFSEHFSVPGVVVIHLSIIKLIGTVTGFNWIAISRIGVSKRWVMELLFTINCEICTTLVRLLGDSHKCKYCKIKAIISLWFNKIMNGSTTNYYITVALNHLEPKSIKFKDSNKKIFVQVQQVDYYCCCGSDCVPEFISMRIFHLPKHIYRIPKKLYWKLWITTYFVIIAKIYIFFI